MGGVTLFYLFTAFGLLISVCHASTYQPNEMKKKAKFDKGKFDCIENVRQFVKCMGMREEYHTSNRFKLDENDCYGLLNSKCLEIYCTHEQYRDTREYTHCKFIWFWCTDMKDHICGSLLVIRR